VRRLHLVIGFSTLFSIGILLSFAFDSGIASKRIMALSPPDSFGPLTKAGKISALGANSLRFEPNEGQFPEPTKFAARTKNYSLFLSQTALVVSPFGQPDQRSYSQAAQISRTPARASLVFVGAGKPDIVGGGKLQSISNYFRGADPSHWQPRIANYSRVEYRNLYPGVNLICHGENSEPEFDWIVQPGADPEQIRFSVQGAEPAIDGVGDLLFKLPEGEVRLKKPAIYQELDGNRRVISGRFILSRNREVNFKIGDFDRTRPLVVDPVLVYSTYLGGSIDDEAAQVRVDGLGNIYVIGTAQSNDFPLVNPLPSQSNKSGFLEAFVAKFDASGSHLVYSTYLAGTAPGHVDRGNAIAVDASGNAYITGQTNDLNFPTTPGAYLPAPGGGTVGLCGNCTDGWVAKLDPTGSSLIFSTYLTGNSNNVLSTPFGIALDAGGNVYLAGDAYPPAFSTTPGAYRNVDPTATLGVFITKMNPTGSALVYSSLIGGNGNDQAFAIALDTSDNAYITGVTGSTNFPETTVLQPPGAALQAFAVKLSASGGQLMYSTLFGAGQGLGIAVDASDNAYIAGFTLEPFPTAGPMQTQFKNDDAFVSKLDPSGATLVYSILLGGSDVDQGTGIALDAVGNAYVTGRTQSADFPTVNAIQPIYSGGTLCAYNCSDAFVTVVSADGSKFLFSTYLGDTGFETGNSIAVDPSGSIYVTGVTTSIDFEVVNPYQAALKTDVAINSFVIKIAGDVSITPQRLVFGPAPLGTFQRQGLGIASATQNLTFTNNSSSAISFNSDALLGMNAAEFITPSDGCANSVVQSAGSCTISVIFKPSAAGVRQANLQLNNSAANAPFLVSLIGYGSPIVFTPPTLAFGLQSPGTTSASQSLTITNTGQASLTVGSLTQGGNAPQYFALKSDACTGTTLAANASCTIMLAFSPPLIGAYSSVLSVNDTGSDSPQSVLITGAGTGPTVGFSSYYLNFANQTVGTTSPPQSVTLTNTGTAPLNISGVTTTVNDFVQTNNCNSPIAVGGSCTIQVSFTPTTTGVVEGAVQVSDNALSSPQQVGLTGTGGPGSSVLMVAPAQLIFANQAVTTTSASQLVHVTSVGIASVTINGISINSDFQQTNNCPTGASVVVNCTINVTFAPTGAGPRSGVLSVAYAGMGSPQTVMLNGEGNDFALVTSPTSSTVAAGGSASYGVTLSPLGGTFNSAVSLSCSSLPQGSACKFSQSSVTLGTNSAQSALTISTIAATTASLGEKIHWPPCVEGLGMICTIFIPCYLFFARFRGRRHSALAATWVFILALGLLWSCGGGSSATAPPQVGTPAGKYTITVTGTAGSLAHSQQLTLVVQ
jgi:hypothetical protein